MNRRAAALAALLAGACIGPNKLRTELQAAEALVEASRELHALSCAPQVFADAEVELSFAKVELHLGDARRADAHVRRALASARQAHDASRACSGVDSDGDGIPDVIDRCPDEPEDFDGDADTDGCRDLDPYGDEDGDGILNIDDACVLHPEDFDGHDDEDGCPETSEDADGDGIPDALDACPHEPEDADGFKDHDGCPDPDNDGDGIEDTRDACPNAPEDFDGWEDDDGCPDDDNDGDGIHDLDDNCPDHPGPPELQGCPADDQDGDGIPDAVDACPTVPEVHNGHLDDDGCPDEAARVRVTRSRIELAQPVTFHEGSSQLTDASVTLLDEVVEVLRQLPGVRVRIEGHTEAAGDAKANRTLSRHRAERVFEVFVRAGLEPERFDVEGHGGERPVDTNRTAAGRERNRRIELHLLR